MSDNCLLKCMIVIVDRGKGESITSFLRGKNVMFSFILPGHGTASVQWQNLLGLGDTKKDVIISLLDKSLVQEVFEGLSDIFDMRDSGRGIAVTADVNSIGGRRFLNYCLGKVEE